MMFRNQEKLAFSAASALILVLDVSELAFAESRLSAGCEAGSGCEYFSQASYNEYLLSWTHATDNEGSVVSDYEIKVRRMWKLNNDSKLNISLGLRNQPNSFELGPSSLALDYSFAPWESARVKLLSELDISGHNGQPNVILSNRFDAFHEFEFNPDYHFKVGLNALTEGEVNGVLYELQSSAFAELEKRLHPDLILKAKAEFQTIYEPQTSFRENAATASVSALITHKSSSLEVQYNATFRHDAIEFTKLEHELTGSWSYFFDTSNSTLTLTHSFIFLPSGHNKISSFGVDFTKRF
jgi:hypothetical protein